MITVRSRVQDVYVVGSVLMQCRFSTLFRAQERASGQPVVLRELQLPAASPDDVREQASRQFIQEGEVLRRLAHRNLPHVLSLFEDEGALYTVLEPFDGHTLDYVVDHLSGPPGERLLLRWMDQVAAALEYLHGQEPPVIYRDLSPYSILLTDDAVIKLVDFGLARMLDDVSQKTRFPGQGPVQFAAPEQFVATNRSAPGVDLYALGATFYAMATGVPPATAWDRAYSNAAVTPVCQVNPSLSVEFGQLLDNLMALRPEDRVESALLVRQYIAWLLGPRPETVSEPVAEPSPVVEESSPPVVAESAPAPAAAEKKGFRLAFPWLSRKEPRTRSAPSAEPDLSQFPPVDLETLQLDRDTARLLPEATARRIGGVCIGRPGPGEITLAVRSPEVHIYDDIAYTTRGAYKPVLMRSDPVMVDLALEWVYRINPKVESVSWLEYLERKKFQRLDLAVIQSEEQQRLLQSEDVRGPAVEAVDRMIKEAISVRASDIHIETYEREVVLRYRIDGILHVMETWPRQEAAPFIKRVKIMSNMDIAQEMTPQGGRISVRVSDKEFDLRVSCIPVADGEAIVMRLLNKGTFEMKLEDLGFGDFVLTRYRRLFSQPHGMLLVSGPTGSGKSTTLYATLAEINLPDRKILTVEDPIEYKMPGICQVQVNMAPREEEKRLTFAKALREFLRQDPDVILVGEIRDDETAAIAVQAALTGHLLLSTIHTNDAPGIITRLRDRGVESFLLSSVLIGGIAQRLVRRICEGCKTAAPVPDNMRGFFEAEGLPVQMFVGKGCLQCHQTGYRGRLAIYEVLEVDDDVRDLIARDANSAQILAQAQKNGMKTLFQDGLNKVSEGRISLEEVRRVCMSV